MSPMNGVMVVSGGKEGEREMSMTSKGKRGYETRTWCIPTYTQYISQVFIYSYMSTGGVCITLLISTWMHSNPRVPFSLVCIPSSVAQGYPAHSSSSRALPQSPSQVCFFSSSTYTRKRKGKKTLESNNLRAGIMLFFKAILYCCPTCFYLDYCSWIWKYTGNSNDLIDWNFPQLMFLFSGLLIGSSCFVALSIAISW